MNIKLTIEYDGTNYCGWQVQPNGQSIQEIMETGIEKILGIRTRLNGSGRTDAGVHASGQVANFITDAPIELRRFQRGLNAVTPSDIVVTKAEEAPEGFDARRDGRSRVYEYRIWNHPWPSAIHRRISWHVWEPLDLPVMRACLPMLIGEHDFGSFRAAGCDAAHAVRKVYRNELTQREGFIVYTVEATAFLRHMVRNIVGTLIEVGRKERTPENFADLVAARNRTLAGPTAPPHGLFLLEVKY